MIHINGVVWNIFLVSPNHPILVRSDGSSTIGVCDNNTKSIYICEQLPMQLTKKVLAHELTHAAMFSYNIDMNLNQEELFADLLATYGQEIVDKTNILFSRLKKLREAD